MLLVTKKIKKYISNMKKNIWAYIVTIRARKEYPCPVPDCGEMFWSTFLIKTLNNFWYTGIKFECTSCKIKFKFNARIFEVIIMGFHQKGGLENLPLTRNRTRIFFPLVNGRYVGSNIFLCVEILAAEWE